MTRRKKQRTSLVPSNKDRVMWALAAISVFSEETGAGQEDAIADLVSDLCHLAAEWKQDPLEEVRRGIRNYVDERDYPPEGWAPQDKLAKVTIDVERGPR